MSAKAPVAFMFKLMLLSPLLGLWILIKRLVRQLWTPMPNAIPRDNPPTCLATIGTHLFIKLKGGVKLHYVEMGKKGEKPLLILLHGFPDFWFGWRKQMVELAKYFHVVALDLKGFGDSEKPSWRRHYSAGGFADELREFILAQGVSQCIIVAHDLGSLLAFYFVERFPEMVQRFVCVSGFHPNLLTQAMTHGFWRFSWLSFAQLPYLPEMELLAHDLRIIEEFLPHLQNEKNALHAYKYCFSRAEDWVGPVNYFRSLPLTHVCNDCNSDSNDNSRKISPPVLFVTGNDDAVVTLEAVVKSTDFCQHFNVKIVEGAGHFPHQQKPQVFNKILLNFLGIVGSGVTEQDPSLKSNTDKSYLSRHLFEKMFTVLDSVQKRTYYGNK